MDEEEARPRAGAARGRDVGRKLWNVLLLLVFLGLIGSVLYLMSERNARRYYLAPEESKLVIKRGLFMPRGERPYRPDDPLLSEVYAPVAIPQWVTAREMRVFEERSELDAALAETLVGWARELAKTQTRESVEDAIHYLERARKLPATSAAQQRVIKELEREVAYHQARAKVETAAETLESAVEDLKRASGARGPNAAKALILLPEIEAEILMLRSRLGATERARPAESSAPPPVPQPPPPPPQQPPGTVPEARTSTGA